MDLISRKNELLRFLLSGIDESHFTRGLDDLRFGFKSYNEFVQYQQRIISQSDESNISTLEFIKNTLVPRSKVVDRPSMNAYKIAGFVFDSSGGIVFYDIRSY